MQQRQQVFSDLALSAGNAFTWTGRGDPEQVIGLHASATLLPTFGLQPVLGRNFSPDEDRPGGEHVVLIGHAMWQQRFNRDPSILGQTLTLDGAPYTIIGVLPEAATAFPLNQLQIWVPRPAEVPYLIPSQLNNGGYFFQAIARLRPGVSLEQARESMNVIAAGYRSAHPGNVDAPSQIEVVPLLDDAVGAQRQGDLLLFGAVGCVLLIACANIANLLLARFAGRRREIAARFALGAGRGDVVRQLVTESMLVAVLGGACGLLLAQWALSALVAFGADLIPRVLEIRIDPVAFGFSLLVTLVAGLAIGLLPALQASSVNVLEALKEAGRGSVGSGNRLRATLLVAEVSLSLGVLIAAGLLLTSFARLQRVKPGFEPAGVFTAQLALPPDRYPREKLIAFYEQFYRRLAALAGSTSAALTDRLPLTGGQTPAPVAIAGRPVPPMSERPHANRHLVSPKYFSTLGIPIRAGRDFDERDSARVPHVVIVNETFARRNFPGEDPIGRTLITGMAQLPPQIVGVVADVRSTSLNTPPESDYFLPALQRPEPFTNILVRTNVSPAAMVPVVRDALRAVDPDLPLLQPAGADDTHCADGGQPQAGADAAGRIRGARAHPREPGRVQRDGAPDGVPHWRDRPSNGARRATCGCHANGARAWPASDARRHRHWDRRSAHRREADAANAVRGGSGGSAHLRRAVSHLAARRRGRVVVPGAARDADRSGDCAAERVNAADRFGGAASRVGFGSRT